MNPVLVALIQNAALLLKLPWEAARRVPGGIGLPRCIWSIPSQPSLSDGCWQIAYSVKTQPAAGIRYR